MNPGDPLVLKCPFCGEEKEVLTLISGNTCGGRQWSDLKADYPMLPRVSPIQKCPACGKYYFAKDAEQRMGDGFCLETGDLTYDELKEAEMQFHDNISGQDMKTLDILLLWAYNDKYNREDVEITEAPEEERKYIATVLDELIVSGYGDELVRAEFLRQAGRFEEAITMLEVYKTEEEFLVEMAKKMKSYAESRKTIAFKCPEQRPAIYV